MTNKKNIEMNDVNKLELDFSDESTTRKKNSNFK